MTDPTIHTDVSISHATMRPQDLIPAFMTELKRIDAAGFDLFEFGWLDSDNLDLDTIADLPDDHEFWDSADAGYVLESLFDALNERAPAGYYFGAHPGDGSDYGFWATEEGY